MKQDKIVIEKTFFVQLIVSLLSTYALASDFFNALWKIPVMIVLVFGVNMYVNLSAIVQIFDLAVGTDVDAVLGSLVMD